YQQSVTLAAEKLFLPNPLRPTAPADRAFGAEILARALPLYPYAPPGPFSDEIQKALAMHLFYSNGRFSDGSVTTAELARALSRARMYLPADLVPDLPPLPLGSTDRHPLTRGQAIAMVVDGLVADAHFNTRLAAAGASVVDSDARVAYALGPQMYLSSFKDAASVARPLLGPIAVATYKGWIPNISTEPGELDPNSPSSLGYVCTLLSRAVVRPGDYTGIIIDMSSLTPLDRAGGMWILNAGDTVDKEQPAVLVYPSSAHLPVRPFFSAPGALAYYGTIESAEAGRAGRHPLIIHALDWAKYDWSITHGDPGLRRGGGTAVPLDHFHFVRGTPPLILLSPEDAHKLQELDHRSLLLRTARVALVQSNWSLTAMR
ncbi:MAG: hypothetical protein LC772_02705, partial [Chloroflexi bacterium]|nr:hypothetical protein [Chloroflexota bacterium]